MELNFIKKWLIKSDKKDTDSNKQKRRFEKWEDAVQFLGKPIRVHLVEQPDIIGNLTGISLVMFNEEIISCLLEVNGYKWEFWKCSEEI